MEGGFHTFGEYMKKGTDTLSAAMEDYMEMIYRLASGSGYIRIGELSRALNVQPPSATKMIRRLADMGYISYKKYGDILLEEKGREAGKRLIRRHEVIESFLRLIGVSEAAVLEETEKIEHTISGETAGRIERLCDFLYCSDDILKRFESYNAKQNN